MLNWYNNKVAYATFRCKNRSSSGIEAVQKTQLWSAYRVGVASKAMSPKWTEIFFSLLDQVNNMLCMMGNAVLLPVKGLKMAE